MAGRGRCHTNETQEMGGRVDLKATSSWIPTGSGDSWIDTPAALELFARQWCDTPEDVVQEAFVKLASARHAAGQSGGLAVSRGTKRRAQCRAGRPPRRRHETRPPPSSTGWFQPEPTPVASESLDGETAADSLRSLPLEQREVIVAHLWGGLSFQEIALVSACSASTAETGFIPRVCPRCENGWGCHVAKIVRSRTNGHRIGSGGTCVPVPSRLDRDNLMFKAGAASVQSRRLRRRWVWPSIAATLAFASAPNRSSWPSGPVLG